MYLLLQSESDQVVLFKTTTDHDHGEPKAGGIPEAIKTKIEELYRSGIGMPKQILKHLRESGEIEPGLLQLKNYLSQIRKRTFGMQ